MCLCRKMQDHIDFLCCEKQLHEVGIAYVALYESEHENTKLHCAMPIRKNPVTVGTTKKNGKRRINSPLPSLREHILKIQLRGQVRTVMNDASFSVS